MRIATHTCRRLTGALGVLLVIGCLAAVSGTASAGYYCNILVSPMSQCSSDSGVGRFNDNVAQYIGAGTVSVCEKETWAGDGYQLSRICGNDLAIGYASNNWSWLGYNELNFVGNNSGSAHTILGGNDPYTYAPSLRAANRSASGSADVTGSTVAASAAPAAAREQLAALRVARAEGRVATFAGPADALALRSTTKGLCLTAAQAGGEITCQDYEKAVSGELLAAAICGQNVPAGAIVLYGVVPDGVSSVEVQTASGESLATAPVTLNTFRLQLSTTVAAQADRLEHVGGDGTVVSLGVIPEDLAC